MNRLKIFLVLFFAVLLIGPAIFNRKVNSQAKTTTDQANRVSNTGVTVAGPGTSTTNIAAADATAGVDNEGVDPNSTNTFSFYSDEGPSPSPGPLPGLCDAALADAPADFDNKTNGFLKQGTPPPRFSDPGLVPHDTFENNKFVFSAVEEIEDGLGPVYNAQSCRECHQNPVTGGISQITELRAGHNEPDPVFGKAFVDAPGGSLINDRSIPTKNSTGTSPFFGAKLQERVPPLYTAAILPDGVPLEEEEPIRTFRTSLNLLGDGFIESIANGTLLSISNAQYNQTHGQIQGQAIAVPVLEANPDNPDCSDLGARCVRRIGRFGWKDQQASLLSFSGDAYLNEMGITNELVKNENSSLGRSVADFDQVADPEDDAAEDDIGAFAAFMRATKAPPRDPDIRNKFALEIADGRALFLHMPGNDPANPNQTFSCSICHVPSIFTAKPCTVINGGQFKVPTALGNKVVHPFSDFLLHDVATGDFIVQNGGQSTRTRVRTPALWGVRTRDRLMHDGESLTFMEAILRHGGEATPVIVSFKALTPDQRKHIIMFLESL
jgi:CxxC motif-containing protein (DUF1111 family)